MSQMRRTGLSRRLHSEKEIADAYLGNFTVEGSRGWDLVMFLTNVRKPSLRVLIRLAEVLSVMSEIQLPRDMRRRRALIVKWIHDHFDWLTLYAFAIKFDANINSD
jgi:hypothetical protein